MDEIENFFCQFQNPWALRVSGMSGYTSKCEKMSKSLHPTGQACGKHWGDVVGVAGYLSALEADLESSGSDMVCLEL